MLMRMDVHGMNIHAALQLRMVNWIVYSMLMRMDVHGMKVHVIMQLRMVT
jgi:hypothetical protein